MKKITTLLVFIFLYSYASSFGKEKPSDNFAQQSVLLKMNLKKGLKYIFTTNTSQLIAQEVMGNKMDIKQHTDIDYIYEVIESNAQGMLIKTTYQNILIDTQTPQGNISYDSKKKDNADSPLKNIGNMVGKSFTMHASAEGEVTQIKGMQEIVNSIGGDATTKQLLKQQFSDSAFINMMNMALNIYPNKEMKIGESWQKISTAEMAGMMKMNTQNTYTLKSLEKDNAIIAVQSNIDLLPLPNKGVLGNIEFNLKGTQSGTIKSHLQSGMITSSVIHQEIKGNVSAQGIKIPMTITSDITLTGREM
ncbi:DUF6263 family protein [Olivibacter domesticus]|uniref:Uncharacterized protein n=1 Tax=Olivibacter domesticus TaxID=407022 RepID=A0A1H7U5K4_OLID1|nr:DUF6263 family protein [Olivibacter domesticus]SEL92253.1 hypothetical protein SAMN05661044_03745 [Olivibacter domesticus]